MRTSLRILFSSAFMLVFCSCAQRVETGFQALPFVDDLLADSLASLQTLAGLSGKASGTIALIGDPGDCLRVSEELVTSDNYDNVDGRKVPDGLPDFAGETISSVLGFSDAPYDSIIFRKDSAALREISVRDCLFAMDTAFKVTPYGDRSSFSKGCPKVLVICSPVVSECALPDIQSLFAKIGCNIPVISSTDTLFAYSDSLYSLLRNDNQFTHDISYPVASGYIVMPVEDNSQYLGSSLVSFDEAYIPASYPDTIALIAPKTVDTYVQK